MIRRSGISLLEVLFAMGVLTVGILGMATLIPLGAYELSEAIKLDSGSTLGRAAFRDLEVRGLLRPDQWIDTEWGLMIAPVFNPDPDTTGTFNPRPGQRLIAYPFLPDNCVNLYMQPLQSCGNTSRQATARLNVPTEPQAWPLAINETGFLTISVPLLGTPNNPPYPNSATTQFPPFAATESPLIVLDPLMVASTAETLAATNPAFAANAATIPPASPSLPDQWKFIQTFPYAPTWGRVPGAPIVPRLTLRPGPFPQFIPSSIPNNPPEAPPILPTWPLIWKEGDWNTPRFMPLVVADRIFRSADDLVFNNADETHDRPTALHGKDQTLPPISTPIGTIPMPSAVQSQGSFSWFVTIAPALAQMDENLSAQAIVNNGPNMAATTDARQFMTSVVVCQNRSLDVPVRMDALSETPPGEWMVPVAITGGGFGGGEVEMWPLDIPLHTAWLSKLKAGQWLMLSGIAISAEVRIDTSDGSRKYWPKFRTVADWYRVLSVDDGAALSDAAPLRRVTLQGTDWPQGTQMEPLVQFDSPSLRPEHGVQYVNLNPTGSGRPYYACATIVEGVVGVYQKTVTLDGDSPFKQ